MAFKSGVVHVNWRSAVFFHRTKVKERGLNEYKNYRGIRLFSVVEKLYVGILVDRVRGVTGCLIDYEQMSFRAGRGCIDQIFILKLIGEKAGEKKNV